jgi:hypothetical protein
MHDIDTTFKLVPSISRPLSSSLWYCLSFLHFDPQASGIAFTFASHPSSRYHGYRLFRVRRKSQGPRPPRFNRLPGLGTDRRPHRAIPTYLHRSVSPLPHFPPGTGHFILCMRPPRWWKIHWFFNFFVAAPIVYAALGMAVAANNLSHSPIDDHKVKPSFLPH